MTSTKVRNDIHSPTNIHPEDYNFERVVYLRASADDRIWMAVAGVEAFKAFEAERKAALDLVEREGWKGGNFTTKRTCDHCGARFNYGVVYRHKPTNELIVVGYICADKTMDVEDRVTLEYDRLKSRVDHMRKWVKTQAAKTRRAEALFEVHPEMREALETDHYIVHDIKRRFAEVGQMTEKQVALVLKLWNESKTGHSSGLGEPTWLPVIEGHRTVRGIVMSFKSRPSDYGRLPFVQMLVRVDREDGSGAEKLWGSVPSGLRSDKFTRGARVEFTADVERSHSDECFGLTRRPTGGRFIEES